MNTRLKTAVSVFGVMLLSISAPAPAAAPAAAAPEMVVNLPEGPGVVSCVYRIGCEVSWTGGARDYTILPAEIGSLSWGTATVTRTEAFKRGDEYVVAQTIELIPEKTGEHDSPEIRVPYLDPEATPPAESSVPQTAPTDSSASPSLRAEPFKIVVRTPRRHVWISGGLGASLFLLLTAVGWWSARQRRPRPTTANPAALPNLSDIQAMLHRITQYRLDGKFYEYYQGLSRIAGAIGEQPLAADLAGRAQRAGYAAARPSDDEMDGHFRELERALNKRTEDLSA